MTHDAFEYWPVSKHSRHTQDTNLEEHFQKALLEGLQVPGLSWIFPFAMHLAAAFDKLRASSQQLVNFKFQYPDRRAYQLERHINYDLLE